MGATGEPGQAGPAGPTGATGEAGAMDPIGKPVAGESFRKGDPSATDPGTALVKSQTGFQSVDEWLLEMDIDINELFGGRPGETISERISNTRGELGFAGFVASQICYLMDMVDPGHCDKVIGSETQYEQFNWEDDPYVPYQAPHGNIMGRAMEEWWYDADQGSYNLQRGFCCA
jgi:hypothetical protein